MRYPAVMSFWPSILLLCALLGLQGCESAPRVVYRDRIVNNPVPVVQQVDPRLTADCEPKTDIPQTGKLTTKDAMERLAAVEDALAICRNDKARLRESQP